MLSLKQIFIILFVIVSNAFASDSLEEIDNKLHVVVTDDSSLSDAQKAIKATSYLLDEVSDLKQHNKALEQQVQQLAAQLNYKKELIPDKIEILSFRVPFHKDALLTSRVIATAGLGEVFDVIEQTSGFYKTKNGWVSRAACKELTD